MGKWGDGIFESDQARDFTWTIIQNLEKEVQNGLYLMMANQDDFFAADYQIVPSLRLIYLILQETQMSPIESRTVQKWKQDYFAHWDIARIAGGDEPYPANAPIRKIAANTFDDLINLAEEWENSLREKKSKAQEPKED